MSDERLRDLERRVRESPGDFVLGHELARALERAGETRRARSEIARLARAGDVEARRTLARRAPPRASATRRGARRALRLDVPWRGGVHVVSTDCWVEAADDERIYIGSRGLLRAIDARTLVEVWRKETDARACLLEDRLALSTERELLVVEPSTGATIASRSADSRLLHASGEGDRVLTVERRLGSIRLHLLDAATLDVVWSIPSPDRSVHVELVADRVVVVGQPMFQQGGTLQVLDVETGRSMWTRAFQGAEPSFLGVDPRGVIVRWQDRYVEFALDSGHDNRFGAEIATGHETLLAEGCVFIARERNLEAVARDTGRSVWQVPFEEGRLAAIHVADEHVWSLKTSDRREGTAMELVAHEVKTGLDVKHAKMTAATSIVRAQLVALDEAMLLLMWAAEQLVVTRYQEAPRAG